MSYLETVSRILGGPKKRLPTLKARIAYLTNVSLMPCLICYLAFTRSFIYRYFGHPATLQGVSMECSKFGWLNNASIRMTCNNRPLDIHATLALAWLSLFSVQALLQKFNLWEAHKKVGKYLGFIAVINVVGMLQLATYDIISPMVTERPPVFTPFMFGTAIIMIWCLYESYQGLASTPRDVDRHIMWITRAFLMSFTTPVIRFYPIVLRYIFSTKCIKQQEALDTWVIGSMTVSCALSLYLFYLVNKACLDEPFDIFLNGFIAFTGVAIVIDFVQTFNKGTFIGHMYKCWKDGNAGPTIFDSVPAHPLLIFVFVCLFFAWLFMILVDSGLEEEEDEDIPTEDTGLLTGNIKV